MSDEFPDDMVEKTAAAMARLDGFTWDELTPQRRRMHYEGQAIYVLQAALTGRTVLPLPELVELPKFQGCTDSDPDRCACGEAALLCAVCDEEIEDGMSAWTVSEKGRPWLRDDDHDQEWSHVWWHVNCDERGTDTPPVVSPGEQPNEEEIN